MPIVDSAQLLEPVSADKPVGDPLDNDPAFLALEMLSQGTPERVMGEVIVPAEAPNWSQLRDQALSLFGRSKDLRVAILLTRALLHTDAIQGVSSGLTLLRGMVDRYWEELHPQPDEDDPADQTERAMVFAALTDYAAMLSPLERLPLVTARGYGSPSLRDLKAAQAGTPTTDAQKTLDAASVTAAFEHCDLDQLQANVEAAAQAVEQGRQLANALGTRLPTDITPDLSPLVSLLIAIDAALRAHLSERQHSDSSGQGLPENTDPPSSDSAGIKAQEASPPIGQINSRADVQRALDEICKYYARHEPSSPLPLLLKRARRLATMSFLDIVQDLIPESVDRINAIKGPEKEKS